MGKKFNSIFMAVVFAALTTFAAVEGAEAFCVYNKTDIEVHAWQGSEGDFDAYIPAADYACCNWKEKSCNKGGSRTSNVKIRVTKTLPPTYTSICEKEFDAGGWLEVFGNYRDIPYSCSAHNVE